ncbi:unnamed protein product [Ceratitis capitata]|uniref:(Mediterranean fruit fly) hypothetical protein n=1 Tax=Ceratitis capitata TaxID=7213 RepID=A0A811ULL3_CERCA|nr:unnamed protein product [Ceratitis capitata]
MWPNPGQANSRNYKNFINISNLFIEYPDDEPGRDSDEPQTGEIGDITKHKLSTLGTPEDVKQAHRSYLQMQSEY